MTLREAHKRIGEIIAERDARGPSSAADNDKQVWIELYRGARSATWYFPLAYIFSGVTGATFKDGEKEQFNVFSIREERKRTV